MPAKRNSKETEVFITDKGLWPICEKNAQSQQLYPEETVNNSIKKGFFRDLGEQQKTFQEWKE